MRLFRHLLPLVLTPLPLAGCLAEGNRTLESVHRPIVTPAGAVVPGCPDLRSENTDSASQTDSNFGCATNSNLAAMIADPNDLVHGRSSPSEGTETATKAIKAWRTATTTAAAPAAATGAGK